MRHSQRRLDTLERRDCKQGLGYSGAEASNHRPRPGDVTLGIGEHLLVLIECDKSCRVGCQQLSSRYWEGQIAYVFQPSRSFL